MKVTKKTKLGITALVFALILTAGLVLAGCLESIGGGSSNQGGSNIASKGGGVYINAGNSISTKNGGTITG